ncbi:SulP family inorganic anion transporter [Dyella tabacisoli]|uniref:SulP family inorganic anion transporter n=1 Tax=Dyella tabacisoli TaxID=2282381 RepID=A0A369UJK5_9GAMM|nr:SulP family inorganic anion transporter [Dyella tabacisoli]RDD80942.1 SulP family inorganic anion transporter [Dyella tabacisoli]
MSGPAAVIAPAAKSPIGIDLLAGLSIAGLLLPEAVAYSGIAGLPPQAGVIALFAGLVCYALIGRSRYAIVSATSSSAAVLAAGTLALAGPDGVSRALIAATLVLLTGGCFLIASAARLGGLSHLIARPVLRGYTFGLACVIALKQLPHLFGVEAARGDFAPRLLLLLLQELAQVKPATAVAGIVALLLLFLCERIRRVPGSLLVIVLGVAASAWLAQHGVALTGVIQLTPTWAWPSWPTQGQWIPSVELAAALLLILYAESYSAIRSFALKHGDSVSANRDLAALGVANIVSGLFHGMPVGAGYSATSANDAAGARSRLSGLVAAGTVLLMVWLLLPWIERIPEPVLAAIVIHAVSKSWRLSVFTPYLKWKRDRLVALAAVLAVLTLGILNGLLVAIAFSLMMLLRQLATPRLSVLGRLADSHDFVDIAQHPAATGLPGVLILRPEEPLFFANAEPVLALARRSVSEQAQLHAVIVSLEESPDLDGTALEALADFADWLSARGIVLRVARVKDMVRELLLRAALPQLPPQALDDWSVEDAVRLTATAPQPSAPQPTEESM